MKEVKKIYESTVRKLTLEVVSSLSALNITATDPLWRILEASALQGTFRLYVNMKISGVHDHGTVVKVIGLNRLLTAVVVKFQCSPEYCYEGTLSGRNNGEGSLPASHIQQALQEVAGIAWFDPDLPSLVRRHHGAVASEPLASVGKALEIAAAPAPVTKPAPPATRGVSRNFDQSLRIFQAMARSQRSGMITSIAITDIVLGLAYGSVAPTNASKSCGPIMTAWTRKGWLRNEGKRNGVVTYSITPSAIRTFDLEHIMKEADVAAAVPREESLPPAERKAEPPSQDISDDNLLVAIKVVKEKAERFKIARNSADEIELKIMKTEDELRKLQGELALLKPTLDDPDLHKAHAIWSGLPDYARKTP